MASSYLEVGSAGLTTLKDDLTKLAKSLHNVYNLMNADMCQVGEAWRDGKYEEFVSGYRPQIKKCEEISQRYGEWCKRVLEPAIEECIEIEIIDVGGGDGSGSGVGIGGASAGSSSDTGSVAPKKSIAAKFNMGTKKVKELNNAATTPGSQESGVVGGGDGSGSGVGIGGASAGSSSDTGSVAPKKSIAAKFKAAKFNMGTKKVKELNNAATTNTNSA